MVDVADKFTDLAFTGDTFLVNDWALKYIDDVYSCPAPNANGYTWISYNALADTNGKSNLLKSKVAVLNDDDDREPVLIFHSPAAFLVSTDFILHVPGADDCVVNLKKSSPSLTFIDVNAEA